MTYKALAASALIVPPYVKLLRQTYIGDPGVPQYIFPKLAIAPRKIRPTDSLDKMVLITDLRAADTTDAIGGSTEAPPADGLKIISPNDRFILLGGSAATETKLYEQAGHLYVNTHLAADIPDNPDFIKLAAFSLDTLRLFAVFNSAGSMIQVFDWSSSDPRDPNGVWNLGSPINAGATITSLELTPAGTFLVANLATTFVGYRVSSLAALTVPAGLYLTASADETEWLVGVNAGSVLVEGVDVGTGAFTTLYTLPTSTGSDRKMRYAPDGAVLMMTGRPASGTTMPRFWAIKNSRWHFITGQTHANAATWLTGQFLMKSDSTQVLHSYCDSGGSNAKVDALIRNTVTPDVLVDDTSPWTGAGSPQGPGARPSRNSAGTLIATANQLMTYDPTNGTWTDVTPAGWSAATGVGVSADGTEALIVKSGAQALWSIAAGVVTSDTMPSSGLPTTIYGGSLSHDGLHMALNGVTASAGVIQIFQRISGVWSTMGGTIAIPRTDPTVLARTKVEWHPTRDDIIVLDGYGGTAVGTVPRYFKLISGTWTEQSSPFPVPVGFTALYGDGAWSPNGVFFAMVSRGSTGNSYKFLVFKLESDDTFSLYVSLDFNPAATGSAVGIGQTEWSVDSKLIAVSVFDAARPMKLFKCDGSLTAPTITAYTTLPASLVTTTNGTGVIFSADSLTLWGNTAVSNHWLYSSFLTYPSYGLDHQFSMTSTGLTPLDTYSYDQQFIHFGKVTDAQHPFSTPVNPTPTYPTSLGFAPGHAITDVYGIVSSVTGKTIIYEISGGGLFVASRPNPGSDYLSSENLQATFVDVYDLVGDTYVERNYSVYEYLTDVHDIDFSPNEEVLSYHVVNLPDAPVDQPQGRLIYDISGPGSSQNFEFRGAVYEVEMSNSYICFSPFNTEFVVIHEHATTHDPFISLHEFNTTDYDYTNEDTKPVEFGPADWSVCDDIVVAHGGSPPLTFFHHNDPANTLDALTFDLDGWENDEPILDIAWSPDCHDLIVLEPGKLEPLTEDPDDPTKKIPDDPTPLDPPIDYDPDDPDHRHPRPRIHWHDDDDVDIDDDDDGTGGDHPPPRHHHWDPLTHDVPDISYVPYVVQTVTFRVYSVPEVP